SRRALAGGSRRGCLRACAFGFFGARARALAARRFGPRSRFPCTRLLGGRRAGAGRRALAGRWRRRRRRRRRWLGALAGGLLRGLRDWSLDLGRGVGLLGLHRPSLLCPPTLRRRPRTRPRPLP